MNAPIDDDGLPDGVAAVMLNDVAGADVPPEMRARMKARVLARIAQPEPPPAAAKGPVIAPGKPGFVDVLASAPWQSLAPGVEVKILFEDTVSRSWMVRLQPGAALPAHDHDEGLEECLVLEGSVWLGDTLFGPGDYQMAGQGTRHAVVKSERGCVMFIRTCFGAAAA